MRWFNYLVSGALLTLLAACASWSPSYQTPQVNVTNLALAPESAGIAPRFIIDLQIINPNRSALALKGMSYSVEIDDTRVLSGAAADLPGVPGYGTADVTVEASPDLLGSARLLNRLLSQQIDGLDYTFKAKLDVGSLLPFIKLEESGTLTLPATP